MQPNQVQFSIASHAAWAPGLTSQAAWQEWARSPFVITGDEQAPVAAMPSMLRRRAGFLGKMALEVAYQCVAGQRNIPTVFCSRHGDVARGMELLTNAVQSEPLSPTNFGLAVHNANAGLFSIARQDQASHAAMAAGTWTVEHGVIEACGLLADGAKSVLLVVVDTKLPELYSSFADSAEQPHAWAWQMVPAAEHAVRLSWTASANGSEPTSDAMPGSLAVWQFYVNGSTSLERPASRCVWRWSRDV
jgi:Beta-ketoacyl synthase, N-terminal domain